MRQSTRRWTLIVLSRDYKGKLPNWANADVGAHCGKHGPNETERQQPKGGVHLGREKHTKPLRRLTVVWGDVIEL